MATVITASTSGSATGYFDIPSNVPAGTKSIVFNGVLSRGEAEFVGRGQLTVTELQRVISVTRRFVGVYIDPIAQTFATDEAHMICGVDVQFSAKGTTNVVCELMETDNGVPTQTVMANALLTPAEVSSTTGGQWTRFTWSPVAVQPHQEYAIVLKCDDDVWAVRVATLGSVDVSVPQLITEQPYTVGVLLKSSNASAWTIDQLSDLTFRLLEPVYSSTSSTVYICSASATSADLVMVSAVVDRPMEGTDVKFRVCTTASTYTTYENFPVLIPDTAYTGSLTVYADLYGTTNASPYLHNDINVLCGAGATSGSYITRTVPCASSGGTCRATMNMNAFVVSNSSITVSAQNGVTGGGDPVWSSPFDLSRSDDLGNNWYDRAYTVSDLTVTSTRFKIVLDSTPQFPALVRNIQAYCVDQP